MVRTLRASALLVATFLVAVAFWSFDEGCSSPSPGPNPNACSAGSVYGYCGDGGIFTCDGGGGIAAFSGCPAVEPYCIDGLSPVQCATSPEPSPVCPDKAPDFGTGPACVDSGLETCVGGYVVDITPCPYPGCLTSSVCAPGTPPDPACRGKVAFYCSDAGMLVDCYSG